MEIDAQVKPLMEAMSKRVSAADMATIERAYRFAREAHASQRRKSGEPYIIHPIAVARIVGEEMELGTAPVCAAFLHDVVEDTPHTIEAIRELFGEDIAFLVNVVTKKEKKSYVHSKQVDNFRQMLDSIRYDIRALLVKLADRLHNMRTLASMRPDKQMKIAGETDYFYAPLANRLGLYNVKTELENLSFRYRCPIEYQRLERLLADERTNIRPYLEDFRARLSAAIAVTDIKADIEIVTRMPYSIRRKMLKSNSDFHHLEQMHSVNIVYDTPNGMTEKEAALRIYSALTDMMEEKPHSLSNYIDHPKENGYQSLHIHLLADNGHWQEVHISSRRMLRVQRLGCIAEAGTNEAIVTEANIAGWIEKLKSTLRDIADTRQKNFMEGVVSSFYNDDITVYTPAGRAIVLPQRATAIDFAFEIHADIGLHARYARINGKLQPVTTVLRRGDIVEIGTDPSVHPDASWLDYIVTYKAKRNVRQWLQAQPTPEYVRCSHCHPLPGGEVIGFKIGEEPIEVHLRECPIAISRASQDGDAVVAVDFAPTDALYPVAIHVRAIDRSHLLHELIDCITNSLQLPILSVNTRVDHAIVDADIEFEVHSFDELQTVIATLNAIPAVDEVWQGL